MLLRRGVTGTAETAAVTAAAEIAAVMATAETAAVMAMVMEATAAAVREIMVEAVLKDLAKPQALPTEVVEVAQTLVPVTP
jgi:hypothetical protein